MQPHAGDRGLALSIGVPIAPSVALGRCDLTDALDPNHRAEDAAGELAEAYAWQARRLGRPTELTSLASHAPELVHARLTLYRARGRLELALTPLQTGAIAYVTSVRNETPHCAS